MQPDITKLRLKILIAGSLLVTNAIVGIERKKTLNKIFDVYL